MSKLFAEGEGTTQNRVRVTYHGEHFWLDLGRVRRALVLKQCDGAFDSIEHVADQAKVSRSTASRFLCRGRASLFTARALVDRLGLRMNEVLEPIES